MRLRQKRQERLEAAQTALAKPVEATVVEVKVEESVKKEAKKKARKTDTDTL